MSEKVLFVDDEPAVLEGYKRLLGRELAMDTALGGLRGLAVIEESGPYGVVVSDMRMPHMGGADFLTKVREIAPTTVRMALTGYTDIENAITAVNEGQIFRFLTKPCSREELSGAIESGLSQHRLVEAEKELLEGTLRGCVLVLSEMLSFTNPAAFGRAMRLRHFVQNATKKLQLKAGWSYEIAAILSQLGCVTLNQSLVNAAYAGEKLAPEDQKKYEGHAAIASQMLAKIPRMGAIAQIIAQQSGSETPIEAATPEERQEIEFGIQLLRVGLAYDERLSRGMSPQEAAGWVQLQFKGLDRALLSVLDGLGVAVPVQHRKCAIRELSAGMILEQDLRTAAGLLIVGKGQELSQPWIDRLQEYLRRGVIEGTLEVHVPWTESRYS